MSEYFLLIIFFIALLIGLLLGRYFASLAYKNEQTLLTERYKQLNKQFHEYKLDIKEQLAHTRQEITVTKQESEKRLKACIQEREEIRREKEFLHTELTRRNTEFENLQRKNQEQKNHVEKLQEKFSKEFENLANKILDEKSAKFTQQNKENITNILNPLQEKIQLFEKKVDDTHKQSIDYHSALRQQIIGLKELNQQMSKDTINLTKALKGDNKMQGNWGELVLERVLEKSGLEKNREYFIQQSITNSNGQRMLPDVVIHLPDTKKMIIDSKVTLTAYERFVNEEDNVRKEGFLKEHLFALKRHVQQLSEKNYQDLYAIDSPDFVLLFVPIEPAFAIAINEDTNLYNKAFEQNIVIVTPTTLLATLRTIDSMWNNEKQQQNAIEIARQAGALYDKFEGLVKDLTGVGKKMNDAQKEYAAAMNKLVDGRGNLISSVEKLKKMGAKAKKSLPETIVKRADEERI